METILLPIGIGSALKQMKLQKSININKQGRNPMKVLAFNGSPRKTWNTAHCLKMHWKARLRKVRRLGWCIFTIWISKDA